MITLILDKRLWRDAAALILLGIALGLACNYRLVLDALGRQPVQTVATAPSPGSPATLYPAPVLRRDVESLLKSGALAIDARTSEIYRQGHLPGALSLPLVQARQADSFTAVPKGRTLIIYCSGYGCTDSFDLGQILMQAGFQDVRVYEGGYPEWSDAGLPVESGEES